VQHLRGRLTTPALAGVAAILTATVDLTSADSQLLTALGGSVMMGGFHLAMVLARPEAIGLGDAKFTLLAGLVLGWFGLRAAVAGLLAAILIGAAVGLMLLGTRRIHLRQGFAHSQATLIGALLVFALAAPAVGATHQPFPLGLATPRCRSSR
jgi:leader peptidase (prepilin peptidase)/N-methyltransferase